MEIYSLKMKSRIFHLLRFKKFVVLENILIIQLVAEIYSKKIWEDVGGFNENIYYQDDYDFWLKIIKNKNFKIGYFNEAGYIYRKHKKNMSKNKIKKNLTKIKVFFSNTALQ